MKPIHPEFTTSGGPSRLLWWLCAGLAGAVVVTLLLAWHAGVQAEQLRRDLARARGAEVQPVAAAPAPLPAYADSARELLAERSTQWQATLLALERTALQGVTPVSIELLVRERSARVEVEFADYAVLMRYLEQLNAGGAAEWALVSAQRSGAGGAVPAGAAGGSVAVLLRRW